MRSLTVERRCIDDGALLFVLVRSLEAGLGEMGLQVEVARSDDEFHAKGTQEGGMARYDIIVLDAWTWVSLAVGWVDRVGDILWLFRVYMPPHG
jgi:hypothetical protein